MKRPAASSAAPKASSVGRDKSPPVTSRRSLSRDERIRRVKSLVDWQIENPAKVERGSWRDIARRNGKRTEAQIEEALRIFGAIK